MTGRIDDEFTALPLAALADAALQAARDGGASYAAFRMERILGSSIRLRDAEVEGTNDTEDVGYSVRVIVDGTWGFAADVERTPEAAARTARKAIDLARVSAPVNTEPVDLSPEPVHRDGTWVSSYEVDPWSVPGRGEGRPARRTGAGGCSTPRASTTSTPRCSRSRRTSTTPTSSGTVTTQQRVRLHPELTAVAIDARQWRLRDHGHGRATGGPRLGVPRPAPGGTGTPSWRSCPGGSSRSCASPSVEPGRYDLVIDPTNLWLTIHESIGHATELDRALGYEANYAGMSFATPDKLGTLQYGSELMHVTGDRTVEHGLSSVGWDDEGVEAQQLRHHQRRSSGRVPARSTDRLTSRLRPLQRLRLRRLSRARPDPAHGQRQPAARARGSIDRRADRRGRGRALRRR